MSMTLAGLDPADFLQRHWQREPLLLRGALPGFEPPIDANDLAGLACEPLAEARLVSGPDAQGGWQLRYGPFEESGFQGLGEENWTLLVQDVEKHYPPLAELLEAFSFLPRWRLDDIMISYAVPGGSVGPHVDQYDVFLLQAQGRRRWEIARHFDPAARSDVPLDMLANFSAEQSWEVGPGNILYLPPGVAHHGVALDECLTYSIGLRAPSAADLLMALGEQLAAGDEGGRYLDPPLAPATQAGLVDDRALAALQELAMTALQDSHAARQFFGAFISRYRLAHEPCPDPDAPAATDLLELARQGTGVYRHPWARFNWLHEGEQARLFASGQSWLCSPTLAVTLCGRQPVTLEALTLEPADRDALLALFTGGQLLLSEEP
jgi:50S ribosomal protein L16 3-hydroxylase